jgi:hypothetical protein
MRLTDEEIAGLDEFLREFETGADNGANLTRRALTELKERRAQDLTSDRVAAIGFAHGIVKCLRFDTDISKKLQADALEVLSRLTKEHGK